MLALEAEDHYVRIHTAHGSALVLMRLSDAVAELSEAEGLQVHRSWWVAYRAIRDNVRASGKAYLHLTNDLQVPVSRALRARLRQRFQ